MNHSAAATLPAPASVRCARRPTLCVGATGLCCTTRSRTASARRCGRARRWPPPATSGARTARAPTSWSTGTARRSATPAAPQQTAELPEVAARWRRRRRSSSFMASEWARRLTRPSSTWPPLTARCRWSPLSWPRPRSASSRTRQRRPHALQSSSPVLSMTSASIALLCRATRSALPMLPTSPPPTRGATSRLGLQQKGRARGRAGTGGEWAA